MKKTERQAYVLRRAREIAATGHHIDYLTIQNALVSQGYDEARDWLKPNSLRGELEQICDQARKRRADA